MEVGTDTDGRAVTFDEGTAQFAIGGIPASIDRLISYDRGGQVNWASGEVRDWAYEYERQRLEYVGVQQDAQAAHEAQVSARAAEAARRIRLNAPGYDASSVAGLAIQLRGLAMLVIISSGLFGAMVGLSVGSAAGSDAVTFIMVPLFGGGGLLVGYLGTLLLKAIAHVLTALVQIEMNTRGE